MVGSLLRPPVIGVGGWENDLRYLVGFLAKSSYGRIHVKTHPDWCNWPEYDLRYFVGVLAKTTYGRIHIKTLLTGVAGQNMI